MQIIIAAVIFAIVFYSWNTLQSLILSVFNRKAVNNTLINISGYAWFWSIVLINIVLLCFSTWFYFKTKNTPGSIGKRGLPGEPGDDVVPVAAY